MSETLRILGTLAPVGTFLVATAAAVVAWLQLRKARLDRKAQVLTRYLGEYREPGMGRAVDLLWHLYEDCSGNEDEMVRRYVERGRTDHKRFHFEARRRVSAFYQEIGFLAAEDRELRGMLLQVWIPGDLEIVRKVLLPLELRGVPLLAHPDNPVSSERLLVERGKIVIRPNWPASVSRMAELYNASLKSMTPSRPRRGKGRA